MSFAVAGNAHRGLGNDFADANGLDADAGTSAAGPVAYHGFQIVAAGIDGILDATGARPAVGAVRTNPRA